MDYPISVPGVGLSAGKFTNGNPLASLAASLDPAEWANAVTDEILNVIVQGGLTPIENTNTQLATAIKNLIKGGDYKDSVRVASTVAINLAAPGANIDGVAMVAGDRFLEKDHGTPSSRGIYIWNGAAVAATRALDADTGAELNSGAIIPVESGTVNADTNWQLTTDGTVTIGTTGLTFSQLQGGLTQATADLRYTAIGYMLVRDEKAQNTSGGSNVNGINTRTLNTISSNTISGASLASNQITLPAGTYRVNASAPTYNVDLVKAYFFNVTDAAVTLNGTSDNSSSNGVSRSLVNGRFTISVSKVFELRQSILTIATTDGLGIVANTAGLVEVYSQVEIIKES